MDIIHKIAQELDVQKQQVADTVRLIDEGNTIPFIARYRKEATGGLDDIKLRELHERLTYLRNLEGRKEEITRLIAEQEKLTDDISDKIQKAQTMTELEDIYRPFRPKRRTRATIAKEKGLEPLADIIWSQEIETGNIMDIARLYIDPEKEVNTPEEAIQGAVDIIAEIISDNADYRKMIREYTYYNGLLTSRGSTQDRSVYEMYYDYSEAVRRIVPHRILAINRGEKERYLTAGIYVEDEEIIQRLNKKIIKNPKSITVYYVMEAIKDAYKRLISPSIEREIRAQLTETAEEQAIKIFGENLRNLLLQPPVKGKVVLGVDPGFRTGNKLAVVDETGKVMDTGVVYITLPNHDVNKGKNILKGLINKHKVDIIAIGNGTASKETEMVIAELLKEIGGNIFYIIVNEAGASVYSASKLASEEFPEYDVALRSAVSIARRLQDPLAELVKIDPKSIGVGQYQHDVNQKRLAEALKGIVEYCVNNVGVDLNTASPSLLQYISGISSAVAKNIVAYRDEIGTFKSRNELLKVKKLGAKAYEQCAGFLRIPGAQNIFDNTAVHPESYDAALKLLGLTGYSISDVEKNNIKNIKTKVSRLNFEDVAKKLEIGVPTLNDIIDELIKPGRDPRDELPQPILRTDVMDIGDLKPDMIFTGTIRNVIDFGAFVDIGVHQDGLVHISQLSDKYIKHPMDVVQVGDIVQVKVMSVDVERKRISLTMKDI